MIFYLTSTQYNGNSNTPCPPVWKPDSTRRLKTMAKHSRMWLVWLALSTFVLMVPGVQQLHADVACCADLREVTVRCASPGCSGVTVFPACIGGPYGGWVTKYTWHCCSASGDAYTCPCLGPCYGGSSPTSAASLPAPSWDTGGKAIFLRTCSGRYALVRPGTAG